MKIKCCLYFNVDFKLCFYLYFLCVFVLLFCIVILSLVKHASCIVIANKHFEPWTLLSEKVVHTISGSDYCQYVLGMRAGQSQRTLVFNYDMSVHVCTYILAYCHPGIVMNTWMVLNGRSIPLTCHDWPASSWWLQLSWRYIGHQQPTYWRNYESWIAGWPWLFASIELNLPCYPSQLGLDSLTPESTRWCVQAWIVKAALVCGEDLVAEAGFSFKKLSRNYPWERTDSVPVPAYHGTSIWYLSDKDLIVITIQLFRWNRGRYVTLSLLFRHRLTLHVPVPYVFKNPIPSHSTSPPASKHSADNKVTHACHCLRFRMRFSWSK